MELKTPRLIMRTNIQFVNGHLVFPSEKSGINLLSLQPNIAEDGGFIFYDNSGNKVCHIGIRTDRKPCEISYGTQTQFRGNGYMQEALCFLLRLFSENGLVEDVYALICNNPESEHILVKNGFVKGHLNEDGGDWFILTKDKGRWPLWSSPFVLCYSNICSSFSAAVLSELFRKWL